MILKAYSVWDSAIGAFLTPFYCRSHGEAMRTFIQSVRKSPSFSANAGDYSLHWLCDWNDATGDFGVTDAEKLSVPLKLMTGREAAAIAAREAQEPVPDQGQAHVASLNRSVMEAYDTRRNGAGRQEVD